MDSIIQEVEKLSLETKGYQVEKENKAFEQIKDSVSTFQTFLQIFLYGIMIAGVGALILVLSLWLRERVYEVGILLALGKGKGAIFSQFCLEVILVSLAAILPAFVAGNTITSYLLKTVLASGDQAALTRLRWQKQRIFQQVFYHWRILYLPTYNQLLVSCTLFPIFI